MFHLLLLVVPIVVLLLLGVAFGTALWRIRFERLRQIIQSLALVVGQGLPLGPALRAFASGERRFLRRAYERMARLLEAGEPLSRSLRRSVRCCPGRMISALEAAERSGTTPTVLRALAAEARAQSAVRADAMAPLLYSCAMLGTVTFVLTLAVVLFAPKFRDIFRDYQLELPPLTVMVVSAADSAAGRLALPALVAPAAVLLTLCIRRANVRPMRARVPLTVRVYDSISWSLPGLRRLVQSQAFGRQLPVMLAALRAGEDLPTAAGQAASVDTNYWAQLRLAQWAAAVERGDDLVQAARDSKLPAPFVRAVAASRQGGDLAAALEYLMAYYRSLAVHWQQVVLSAALPVVVVGWGILVAVVALSILMPVVSLMQSLIDSIG